MRSPILFIDVDGPLNPWAEKSWRRPEVYVTHHLRPSGWEKERNPLRVWLRPDHGALLLELSRETGLELVWATTWQHDANKMIGPAIGLPELPVVDFADHPGTLAGWEFPAVADFADGRPLAWLDDDFRDTRWVHALSEFLLVRSGIPTLLRYVDPRVGMTHDDLRAIRQWAMEI